MVRLPQLNLPDTPQHVPQRGNNEQAYVFNNDGYKIYLDKLKLYSRKYKIAVHSYVLMTPETEYGVNQLMQSLERYYVRYINQTYDRTDTLREGRYKSTHMGSR